MKPATIAPIPWGALRVEYARTGAKSLRAFAEEHDVPYKSLCQRAKREGWRRVRDLWFARQRVRESEAELAFARKVATTAGKYVARLAGAVTLPLEKLAVDAWAAHFAVSSLWTAALRLRDAQHELAEMQGGAAREEAYLAHPATTRTGWERESAWPEFNVLAYRERGPASVPKKLTPAKLAVPIRKRTAA
jgi:hypothetical protein